mmetsp:Transcript_17849/g.33896  ORF Transcript_17849/g.33896 Transcript_17849/m.33896 type:complete len:344 (-) Transcript_17849:1505-2536(-)
MNPSPNSAAPPRRPPRRWQSSGTTESLLDDVISEDRVFRPPCRNKSSEELEAELLGFDTSSSCISGMGSDDVEEDNGDIPNQIDFSQLASHLHEQLQLQHNDLEDDLWDSELGDDAPQDGMTTPTTNTIHPPYSHKRRGESSRSTPAPSLSFSSIGSSMTRAQKREPGRFVTPASSFHLHNNNDNNQPNVLESCQGVQPVERVTVDPFKFMTADMSFRLPLVGPLTDNKFMVPKKKSKLSNRDDDNDLQKEGQEEGAKQFGRKTIQLDTAGEGEVVFPTISLDDDNAFAFARPPAPSPHVPSAAVAFNEDDPTEEETPPPPPRRTFGLVRESRRSLLRPAPVS